MTDDLKDIAWSAARILKEYDSSRIRLDACDALIAYDDFNNVDSMFGWEIDHIFPVSRLRELNVSEELWNHPLNIRALHWKNNWSKGVSYPMYTSSVIAYGDTNMEQQNVYWISDPLQDSLRSLFKIKDI